MDKELENAHRDYEKRKNEMVMKLLCIRDSVVRNPTKRKWLTQVINFIHEKEI